MIVPIYESNLTLKESLGVLAYNCSIYNQEYRKVAEWLNCYEYILPEKRTLNESALHVRPAPKTASAAYHLYCFTVMLETHYTSQEQSNIILEILCHKHR